MNIRNTLATTGVIACLFCALYSTSIPDDKGEKTVYHIVKQGDTLWDISKHYKGDPWLWQSIWKLNDFIGNPHLIYPNQKILLTAKKERPALKLEPSEPAERKIAPMLSDSDIEQLTKADEVKTLSVQLQGPVDEGSSLIIKKLLRPVPLVTEETILRGGFIEKRENLPDAMVIDIKDEELWATQFGKLHIDRGTKHMVKKGDVLLVFSISKPVRHVLTNEKMGVKVLIKGKVKVISTKENTSECMVAESYEIIEKGDYVMRFKEIKIPNYDALLKPDIKNDATVIAILDPFANVHLYDMLFIDKGIDDGIRLGDRFDIYKSRKGRKHQPGENDPIGVLKVVNVRSKTASVMLISHRSGEVDVGDRVVLQARCRIVNAR